MKAGVSKTQMTIQASTNGNPRMRGSRWFAKTTPTVSASTGTIAQDDGAATACHGRAFTDACLVSRRGGRYWDLDTMFSI